jgi:MFS family permease
MTHASAVRGGRAFFGWYIVGAAFTIFFLTFGFMYSFSVIAKPIADAIHYDVEGVSTLFSLSFTVYLLAGVPAGFLVDRIGARIVIAVGGFLTGFGIILASQATTNLQISLAFGLAVGLGLACLYVPATNVVQAWFVRGRGYATGITVLGFATGNLVIGPLIAESIIRFGVRPTLAAYGVILMVVIPVLSLVMVGKPEDLGLYPDGDSDPSPLLAEEQAGMPLSQATHTRPFWHLYLAIFVASFAIYLPFVHLGTSALKTGASPLMAGFVVAMLGLGGIFGRLVLGRASDRIRPRHGLLFSFLGLAASMVIWYRSPNPLGLAVFALVYGFFYTWSSAVEPPVIVDYFGEKHSGAIMGMIFTSAAAGSLLGPTIGGEIVDRTGSYDAALVTGAILFVVSALSMLTVPDPPDFTPAKRRRQVRLRAPRL